VTPFSRFRSQPSGNTGGQPAIHSDCHFAMRTGENCCCGPTESKVAQLYIAVAVGPLWKQARLLYTLQLQRGASRCKCLACFPLNTPLHITLTKISYENMKPIEHVLLHPICVLSHLMCPCKHVKLSLYYSTHWSCWWVYHFKKHRYHAIFL